MLSDPRPGSTAGLHHASVPAPRAGLPALPSVPIQWCRGLVNPRYLHRPETEDGRPRTLRVDGYAVGVAVCRAWLTGAALVLDPDLDSQVAVPEGLVLCRACLRATVGLDRLRGER